MRNISNTVQSFTLRPAPKQSPFKTDLLSTTARIAPGMYATISVLYRAETYTDIEETITVVGASGCKLEVALKSQRSPPRLIGLVYKGHEGCHFPSRLLEFDSLDEQRAETLNSTIDCGSCFRSNSLVTRLVFANEGNTGRFCLVSEKDWYLEEVNVGGGKLLAVGRSFLGAVFLQEFNDELVLRLGQFTVWPAYFEIGPQEVIEVNILFGGVGFGLATEKMVMICDNNSYEEIDLVADVIMFDKELFTVEVELTFEHFYMKNFKN